MTPDIILYYWYGSTIPKWRQDCADKLIQFYPNAKIIRSEGQQYINDLSNKWRLLECSKNPYTLWVDNDIELYEPLKLNEKPAMADEYGCGHCSIIWSGNNPKLFQGITNWAHLQPLIQSGEIEKIKIPGIHWKHTTDNIKVHN
jgi:hypothetical protein